MKPIILIIFIINFGLINAQNDNQDNNHLDQIVSKINIDKIVKTLELQNKFLKKELAGLLNPREFNGNKNTIDSLKNTNDSLYIYFPTKGISQINTLNKQNIQELIQLNKSLKDKVQELLIPNYPEYNQYLKDLCAVSNTIISDFSTLNTSYNPNLIVLNSYNPYKLKNDIDNILKNDIKNNLYKVKIKNNRVFINIPQESLFDSKNQNITSESEFFFDKLVNILNNDKFLYLTIQRNSNDDFSKSKEKKLNKKLEILIKHLKSKINKFDDKVMIYQGNYLFGEQNSQNYSFILSN